MSGWSIVYIDQNNTRIVCLSLKTDFYIMVSANNADPDVVWPFIWVLMFAKVPCADPERFCRGKFNFDCFLS